jgi:4,4'-diaponeurosporenoate glycosyltransferase
MIFAFLTFWMLGWLLAYLWRRPAEGSIPATAEDLSIIIPARNEAHNLPKLLQSLRDQSVTPREIIVVNDGSTDATAALAKQFGAAVIDSAPLPAGWRGKTWACHQGAAAARGSTLLFLDADTWFEPGGLERMLRIPCDGALSIAPYHAVQDLYENLSLFFNVSMIAGTVPSGLLGQSLLVSRQHYQQVGGHESVRGKILENFQMAQQFRDAGIPVTSRIGKGIFSFRMYPEGLRSLVQGWTKGFAAGAGGTPPIKSLLVVLWMIGMMFPPMTLLEQVDMSLWAGAYVLCVLQLLWMARSLGSFSLGVIALYPLPLLFFFGLFGWSILRSGKQVKWKGRDIHAD